MHFIAAYNPRLQREPTIVRPHHVCSIAFAPQPEYPASDASPRKKSVAAPRAKKKTGSHHDTIPTTAKYVKYNILDHAIAQNVDLRAHRSRQIFSPRDVPIERV